MGVKGGEPIWMRQSFQQRSFTYEPHVLTILLCLQIFHYETRAVERVPEKHRAHCCTVVSPLDRWGVIIQTFIRGRKQDYYLGSIFSVEEFRIRLFWTWRNCNIKQKWECSWWSSQAFGFRSGVLIRFALPLVQTRAFRMMGQRFVSSLCANAHPITVLQVMLMMFQWLLSIVS